MEALMHVTTGTHEITFQHLTLHGYQSDNCTWLNDNKQHDWMIVSNSGDLDYVCLVQEWSVSGLLILQFQDNKVHQGSVCKEFSLPAQKQNCHRDNGVGKTNNNNSVLPLSVFKLSKWYKNVSLLNYTPIIIFLKLIKLIFV